MSLSRPDPDAHYRTPGGRSLGTIAYFGVMLIGALGLAVAVAGSWRQGAAYIGVALLLACVARLALPDRMAGLLRVRRKVIDVTILGVLGLGVVVLALLIPDV